MKVYNAFELYLLSVRVKMMPAFPGCEEPAGEWMQNYLHARKPMQILIT